MENLVSILIKKWRGAWTPDEQEALEGMLKDKAVRDESNRLEQVWEAADRYRNTFAPDPQPAWEGFRDRAGISGPATRPSFIRQYWWAILIGLGLVGGLAYKGFQKAGVAPSRDPAHPVYATEEGEERLFVLADGSEVTLNENSTLAVLDYREEGAMKLHFSGEGYFSVVPRTSGRFMILAGDVEVKVMGTAFNLRAIPGEFFTELEVEEGEVEFKDTRTDDKMMVRANYRATCFRGAPMVLKPIKALNAQSWLTEDLYFEDQPLEEVLTEVGRYFEVSFTFETPALTASCPITTNINGQSDLDGLLGTLEESYGMTFREDRPDHYLVIGGEACD